MTDELKAEIELILPDRKNLTKFSGNDTKKDLANYWDKDFIKQKMENITSPKDKMLCELLWRSGVRISEALTIRKQDIDFKNYMIKVKWLKSRKYNERIIPMHPTLKLILEAYTGGFNAEDRLFPYTRTRAYQIVKKWFNGHPHQFRHSFAVNFLQQNGRIEILKLLLGHKSIQATMEYSKLVPIDQGRELLKISFD